MDTPPFDTLTAQKTLTKGGIEDNHATLIVDMTRNAITETVVTKTELKVEIGKLKIYILSGMFFIAGSIIAALIAIIHQLSTLLVPH